MAGAPNLANTTMPSTIPATTPTYVSTEETMRPAEVIGKPLMPSWTAETIRKLGTNSINDDVIINAGSRKISDQYSPKAITVAIIPPAIVEKTSGARQRPIKCTVAMLSVEAPILNSAENHEP